MTTSTTPVYDKQQRVIAYFQHLATYVKAANSATTALPQLDAESALAPMDQQTSRQVNEHRKMLLERQKLATEKACEKAHRTTLEQAEGLVQQIEARLSSADEIQRGIRAYEAQFELAVSLGEFDDQPEERAMAEERLTQLRARFEKQIDLAYALVPVESSLLKLA